MVRGCGLSSVFSHNRVRMRASVRIRVRLTAVITIRVRAGVMVMVRVRVRARIRGGARGLLLLQYAKQNTKMVRTMAVSGHKRRTAYASLTADIFNSKSKKNLQIKYRNQKVLVGVISLFHSGGLCDI